MMNTTYLVKKVVTSNHAILPCAWLCTLIPLFPDAILQQTLGFKASTLGAGQHWTQPETIPDADDDGGGGVGDDDNVFDL